MQNNEKHKEFLQQNAYAIFAYINTSILKDIGVMNPDYFIKTVQDIMAQKTILPTDEKYADINILPYSILTTICNKGRVDYTSLRAESINFAPLNKEAAVYYNYAQFSLKDTVLCIALMQSKIGGMPIDDDIVKFTKNISINPVGLEQFIIQHTDIFCTNKEYEKIQQSLKNSY